MPDKRIKCSLLSVLFTFLLLILPTTVEAGHTYPTATTVSVMIDNASRARPQSGLDQAVAVYEMTVAPGVTRYMAVFQNNQQVNKLGPVRSAREPFVDIACGHGGVFVHAGASTQALYIIPQRPVIDLDEIYNAGKHFYRSNDRRPPHNLYTNMTLINQRLAQLESPSVNTLPFQFGVQTGGKPAAEIIVKFKWIQPETRFLWCDELQKYLKYNGHDLLYHDNGRPITGDNVVILYTEYEAVPINAQGELKAVARVTGMGDARFFRDGMEWAGTWERWSFNDPFVFRVDWGLMQFREGNIWILLIER